MWNTYLRGGTDSLVWFAQSWTLGTTNKWTVVGNCKRYSFLVSLRLNILVSFQMYDH